MSKPSVVFDGDSITALATPAIHQLFDPSYHVEVLGVYGISIRKSLPRLISALRTHPYAVVENLGTNDVWQGEAQSDWMSSWDQLIHITRATPCVVLTTIGVAADYYGHKSIAASINSDIMSISARDPKKYEVADWNGFLNSRRNSDWRTYLLGDLIHPTSAGGMEIARLDKHALAKCGGRTS